MQTARARTYLSRRLIVASIIALPGIVITRGAHAAYPAAAVAAKDRGVVASDTPEASLAEHRRQKQLSGAAGTDALTVRAASQVCAGRESG